MNLENVLKDNIILVVPDNIREKVLLYLNSKNNIYNIKIINLNNLVNTFLYQYDEKTIHYLMNKYHFKYDVAKTYLDNIKYLNGNGKDIEKIKKLYDLKDELLTNKLLYQDEILKEYFMNKEIIIYGYDNLISYQKYILDGLNYTFIKKDVKKYEHKIYELNTIDDEIEYVAIKIIELINNGTPINKIKLTNVNKDYYIKVEDIFKKFNLPLNHLDKGSIYETNITKYFLDNIADNNVLELIKEKFDLKDVNNYYVYHMLINILNKYTFISDYTCIKDMLINEFKNTKNYYLNYDNSIEVIDLKDNIIADDEYVFLIGFNMEYLPTIYKDEDYIDDKIKPLFNLDNHYDKNRLEITNLVNIIKSIKNLVITYKKKTYSANFEISSLNDYLNYEVIKIDDFIDPYSVKMNELKLANMLDDLNKYNKVHPKLDIYFNSFNIPYFEYDNRFTGIDKNKMYEYLDNKLVLSYSSIDSYYRCGFRYYINNILKLNPFTESFEIIIGNIFHEVLSKCFNRNFNFNESFNEASKNYTFDAKETFYMKRLKDELKFVIDTLYEQNSYAKLDKFTCERKIFINKDKTIKVTFMGVIDKMIHDEDKKYLVIVDYKTGFLHTNLFNMKYGIGMQLPIYLYLAKNDDDFKNARVIGFYLQKIINNGSLEKKKDSLKLEGYSNNNPELLEMFDSSFTDSNIIRSLKCGQNGFYKYSKTISNVEIEKITSLIDKKINEARDKILDADFSINPKKIGDINVGCEFCKNKDICFMKESNLVYLDKYNDFSFLDEE